MATPKTCRGCGAEIAPDAPFGHCGKCLIQLGFLDAAAAEAATSESDVPSGAQATVRLSQPMPAMGASAQRRDEGARFGDYQLLGKIAEGGMGVVYKARQLSLNRIVAVKMIRADRLAREEDIRRFRTEAQAAAQLQHPNVVAIHEVGEVQSQHFYSMDYVAGESLS